MKIPDDSASSHPATEPARSSPEEGQCRHERETSAPHIPSPELSLNLSAEVLRDFLEQLFDGKAELRDLPRRLQKDHQALPLGASSTNPGDEEQLLRYEIMVLRSLTDMLVSNIRLLPRFLRTILADVAGTGSPSQASSSDTQTRPGKPGFCGPSDTGWEPA